MSIVIGGLAVASRFFLAPINTGLAEAGAPTPELVDFHRKRSGKNIGIGYVGNVAVHPDHRTNPSTLCATSSSRYWAELASAIEDAGSIAAVQLAMRLAARPATRSWVQEDALGTLNELVEYLASIPTSELDSVPPLFRDSARAMAVHGFRVVQLHAAHGYLLSQLLSPTINRRSDEYGRDPTLLLRRCVEEVLGAVPDVVMDIRVSLDLGESVGVGIPEFMLAEVAKFTDLVSVSAGHYELSRELIYPARRAGENVYLRHATALAAKHDSIAWNCAGNIRSISELSLSENMTVSFGRPLLADPNFVDKSLTGRAAEIASCDWNGACHYYTRGRSHIECPLSPDIAATDE